MRIGSRIFSSVNTKSIVFGSVIIFACAAFIFTGFGHLSIGGFDSMSPTTAATVDSLQIEMNEFVNVINQQGLGNVTGPEKKYVAMQVIKQLVNQKILANESIKIGWQASDKEIATAIRSIPVFQDPATHQFSMELFKNYVSYQQMSEVDFYNYLRSQLSTQKMQNLIYMPVVLSNAMLNNLYAINNVQFNLQYAIINLPETVYKNKIDDAAKTFAANQSNLQKLQDQYVSQKDQYNQKAKTRVRSILVSYKNATRAQGDALNRSKEEAHKLLQSMLNQIKHGKDFSILASSVNDDEKAKQNKGDIGYVDEATIDAVSLSAIANLSKENFLSDIVDTPFGYRLFQYEDSKPAIHKNFEEVKIDLAKQLVTEQVKSQTENDFLMRLSSALTSKNITMINTLLVENGLSWKYLGKQFKVTDAAVSELGDATNLAEEVFLLKKSGDVIPKIINFGSQKAIVKLDSITPASQPSLVDIEKLKKQILAEQSQLFAQSVVDFYSKNYEKDGKIKINPIITQ
jgi:peptidyl-prolyl cis-trans isomerase D